MSPEEVAVLQKRVGDGLTWLSDNDPFGNFYAWWQVGLTPSSRLPAHEGTPDVVERFREWFKNKVLFDHLDKKLAIAEQRGQAPLPWALPWVPAREVRR